MKSKSHVRYLYFSLIVFMLYSGICCSAFMVTLYDSRGITQSQVGIILAISSAVSIFSPPVMGILADKIRSKRKTLMLTLLVGGITNAILPLLAGNFILLLATVLIGNAFRGASFSVYDAWLVAECAEDSKKGGKMDYGAVRLWGSVGYSLFSLIFGWMVKMAAGEVDIALYIGGSIMTLTGAMCLLGRQQETGAAVAGEGKKSTLTLRQLKPQRLLKNYYFVTFFFVFILVNVTKDFGTAYLTYLLQDIGKDASYIGVLNGIKAAAEVPLMLVSGKLAKKFGYEACIFSVGLIYAVEHLCYSWAASPVVLIVAQVLHGAFSGLFMGLAGSYLFSLVPGSLSTSAQTFAIAGSNIMSVLGNLGSGYLLEALGVRVLYQCIAIPPAIGILLFGVTLIIGKSKKIARYDGKNDPFEQQLAAQL